MLQYDVEAAHRCFCVRMHTLLYKLIQKHRHDIVMGLQADPHTQRMAQISISAWHRLCSFNYGNRHGHMQCALVNLESNASSASAVPRAA